jgi:hypothetical protein
VTTLTILTTFFILFFCEVPKSQIVKKKND